MPRIEPLATSATDKKTAATLKEVRARLGVLPNLVTTLARAPAALDGYLGLSGALGKGKLSPRQRELIAIAIAQENGCEYCLSAHTAIGQRVGLGSRDIRQARLGGAVDSAEEATVRLALAIVRTRGAVGDDELLSARQAGLDDGLIVEIVANVALNVLTNYLNRLADTEVDFPLVRLSAAA